MDATAEKQVRVAIAIELHYNLPWHLDTFQGIVDFGKERGWDCVVDPYLDGLSGDGDWTAYDGVVGRIGSSNAMRAEQLGLPAVGIARTSKGVLIPSVIQSNTTGIRLAAEHLLSAGYRHYGYVGNAQVTPGIENKQREAFENTLAEHGFTNAVYKAVNEDDLGDPDRSSLCRRDLTKWITTLDKPIGLCVDMVTVARYLAQTCIQQGLLIPKDVGIIVNNTDILSATHLSPALSAVHMDHWGQGREAAAMLERLMQGKTVSPRVSTLTPTRVIARESTDVFLSDDELVSKAMRYISERNRQPLQSDEVAVACGVSRRTLDRRFEQTLGHTVSQAIKRQRLQAIELMLLETDLAMNRIAELCGFGSASQFSDYYREHAGISPSAFRDQNRSPA